MPPLSKQFGELAIRWVTDMGFLSNPPTKIVLAIFIVVGAVGVGIGFYVNRISGILVLCVSVLFLIIFLVFIKKRYQEIDQLTRYLNQVLYGDYTLTIMENDEGELKILKSEIYKMTVMLREQADALEKDKIYLADSIADISHQLRTPLTSMGLILSLLSRKNTTPQRQMDLLRELTVLLRRMDSLISALLKISKIDAGTAEFQSEPVLVQQLIEKAAEPIVIPLELRGQTIQIKGDPNVTFLGDEMWSVEALGNILKNCMEHMDENGVIQISYIENALYTEITIKDNGKGISKEDLPHIFERFYRGENADSSSFGIGLALSRMIITEQNGTIKAGNNPEGGMYFIIRFYKGVI